jgi:hypothetical protein
MLPKFVTSALSKAQILEFLGLAKSTKIAKDQLVEQLLQHIAMDSLEKERLLATFLYELAVEPGEIEELLQCTAVERRRWIKEGKLPVLEYRTFRKLGRNLEYSVHDRREILKISQDEIQQWREAHQQDVQSHRKAGAQAATERRKVNRQIRHHFLLSWQQTLDEWKQKGSAKLVAVLVLAYWTLWASRWAKENHVKSLRGRKYAALYVARRDAWYERKNQAMRLLAQTPYASLSFYRPSDPDKHYLWLCEEHYEMKCEEYYDDIWEFYYHNVALVEHCSQCVVTQVKDYYSLYHLEITTTVFPDIRFSFHMPYPIGRAWLPAPQQLPRVEHIEQDGMFRFGRPLLADEKITYREQDVASCFELALTKAQQFFVPDDGLNEKTAVPRTDPPVVNGDDVS